MILAHEQMECISYLLLCNKFPQIDELKKIYLLSHILNARNLMAAQLGGSGLWSLMRLQSSHWLGLQSSEVEPSMHMTWELASSRLSMRENEGERDRQREAKPKSKMEATVFYCLIFKVTYHHFCHTILFRGKSLSLVLMQGQGN